MHPGFRPVPLTLEERIGAERARPAYRAARRASCVSSITQEVVLTRIPNRSDSQQRVVVHILQVTNFVLSVVSYCTRLFGGTHLWVILVALIFFIEQARPTNVSDVSHVCKVEFQPFNWSYSQLTFFQRSYSQPTFFTFYHIVDLL